TRPSLSLRGRGGVVDDVRFDGGARHELSANVVPGDFCDPRSASRSGYFGVDGSRYDGNHTKRYFYWMIERRSTSMLPGDERIAATRNVSEEDVPFLVWLQGGPGCSSLLALLEENGPCLVNKDGHSTTTNPYSWTEVAHVLYLDQPAMTGYSYGEINDNNQAMVADDAYFFLQSFFQSAEGSKYKDLPLYLTGESYAGHYAPSIAHRIQLGNDQRRGASRKDLLHLRLAGIAIGNGAIDETEQLKWFPEMAYRNPHGLKIINETRYEEWKVAAGECSKMWHECNEEDSASLKKSLLCQKAYKCKDVFFGPLDDQNISNYDISKPCIGEDCVDDTPGKTCMNLKETKKTMGIPLHLVWEPCSDAVEDVVSWKVDNIRNFGPYISEILNEGTPALIYVGDLDYTDNYMGVRAATMKFELDHSDDSRHSAKDHDWNDGGGLARSSHGLSYLQVYNAGHMAPGDQPKQCLDMIAQFLRGDDF
ncbi:hypothetical protein ACHAWF_006452, partial [Thalassiosira exigua]